MNGYILTEDKRRELANRFMRIAEGRSDYFGKTQRQLLNEAAMPATPAPAAPMPADPNMMGGAMPAAPAPAAPAPADPNMMGGAMPAAPAPAAPMPADPNMMGGAMPGVPMPGAPGGQGPTDTNNDGVLDDLNGDGKTDDLTGDGFPNIDDDASSDNTSGGEDNAGGDANADNNTDAGQNKNNELGNNEIANGQEIMNDKVDLVGQNLGHVDNKIAQMFGTINRLINMVDSNNRKIEDLSKEVAKRNPTPTERLNIRSQDGYPFNIPVSDFWKEKARTSNYRAYADNDEPTTNEYRITNSDVDDFSDRDMEASFDVDGEDLNQTINKIFGYH